MSESIMQMRPQDLKDVLFIAVVVSGNDPEREGEVQIRISKRMDGMPDADLPWARPVTQGAFFKVPDVGEKVYVEFQQGSVYHPIYYARAIAPNGAGVFTNDYPNSWGMSDGTNFIRINKNSGIMEFVNNKGVKITMGNETMLIDVPKTYTLETGDNVVINAGKNVTVTAATEVKVEAMTATVTATGPVKITGTTVLLNS